jgi:excisionase family DNA binding protein
VRRLPDEGRHGDALEPVDVTRVEPDVPSTSAVEVTLKAAGWEALVVQRRVNPGEASGRELYDIPRVAAILDVRESFVRRLVAQRRIPFFKIGKFIRFDPDEIGQWPDHRRAEVLR